MRQIGTIADQASAQVLADYLLTQKIETRLNPGANGWEVWVCDEDRIARAREELTAFNANPRDPRFLSAVRAASEIRRSEERADEAARKRQVDLRDRLRPLSRGMQPVTAVLIAICVVTALVTDFAAHRGTLERPTLTDYLFISPFEPTGDGFIHFPGLTPILQGQVWRLVTPIFLHFNFLHLLGNMLWLYYLGNVIEARRGPVRYLALILVIAVVSDLAEYCLGSLSVNEGRVVLHYHPNFGGMSGVVFGLFGYTWMKMRFEPELGLAMTQQTFVFSILWLLFCLTGIAGNIANGTHIAGLAMGIVIGATPALIRRLRG
jgi:GlpG protein